MNNQQRKSYSSLARILGSIILVVVCNIATIINSPAQAANAIPSLNNIECLFNWAQTFYPNLFSPPVSGVQFFSPYTYRYYPGTNAYLGVSSTDNHVHYLRPDGTLQDVGDSSTWLRTSGCGEKPYPVIFIHGLASGAATWTIFRDYLIKNGFWTFGGIPAYNPATKTVSITCPVNPNVECTGGKGDFYTLNFSDNQGAFDIQGGELAAIVKAVLAANPGKTKALLVGHSMGALAAREYLQGLARESDSSAATIPYRGDVAKLVTIAAINQGSFWADECRNHINIPFVSGSIGICNLLPLNVDPNSIAIEDLVPNSPALNTLNDLAAHPLPSNISYVSIIGTGQPTLVKFIDFKDGDGIASDTSQDLKMLAGSLPQQESVRINVPFREGCGNKIKIPTVGEIGQTHTCETTDIGVGGEVLKNLQ